MKIKSLALKNKLIDQNTGENYFDLSAPSFKFKSELGLQAIHYVVQDQVGRIDKIAQIYYGSTAYIDAICVTNGIFNPFSIKEGDILVIPNLSKEDLVYRRPNTASRPNEIQSIYIDTNVQSEKDQSRVQRLIQKAKTKKSGVKTPLPPNVLQQGQETKEFRDGRIFLGTNLNVRKK